MKKIGAFLVALLLFFGTVLGLHYAASGALDFNNPKFGAWISDKKFQFGDSVAANLESNSLVVFGSSEFGHGRSTPYHPMNLLSDQNFQLMLMGAGYYQSLSHATELSVIAPYMNTKKAVLILSPQWFRREGVKPEAYASRFSEWNYIRMLENDKISKEVKEYIASRTEQLLKADPPARKRVEAYNRVLLHHNATGMEKGWFAMYQAFLKERGSLGLLATARAVGITHEKQKREDAYTGLLKTVAPDWSQYEKQAVRDAAKQTSSNPFRMKNSFYKLRIKPRLEQKKDSSLHGRYDRSSEYDDLKCFLQVCKEEGIEPMLVLVPVNGPWYDYTGFPKKSRQAYYQRVRQLAKEEGVRLADFSGDEYTPYFFEDNVHLGWKGWVDVDESIYQFAQDTAEVQ